MTFTSDDFVKIAAQREALVQQYIAQRDERRAREANGATMTRQELNVFLQKWFCGCGSPEDAASALHRLLSWHDQRAGIEALDAILPDNGMQYLMLYTLDHFELTEHGGSVIGGWLTDKGKAVLAALEREKADNYEALFAHACIHGYAVDGLTFDCPECK